MKKMEATKDRISLETAQLLKERKLESKYTIDGYPAYTWQEILWEYPKEFFVEESESDEYALLATKLFTEIILSRLREGDYTEADLCFRKYCILINKKNGTTTS